MRGQPSQTAEGVCWMRGAEQRRKPAERIVDDPYAKFFLGPMLGATLNAWEASGVLGDLAELFSPGLITFVLCRHRYIDDCLRRALGGNLEQVVILGAGYDMRAYRLAQEINHRPVFEVDHPATSRRKARILAVRKSELPVANQNGARCTAGIMSKGVPAGSSRPDPLTTAKSSAPMTSRSLMVRCSGSRRARAVAAKIRRGPPR